METTNRLKVLNLIECLKNYGEMSITLYRKQGLKQSPRKRNTKKAKWLSEEALQIAEKRREMKGKGGKKRYTHLNSEFQRIAGRDQKAFLSEQCKELEENNRMGKTRDLFKKIRDTKGTFHVKMNTIKDKNSMDLIEAEEVTRIHRSIQKRSSRPRWSRWCDHSPRARHPGMWS